MHPWLLEYAGTPVRRRSAIVVAIHFVAFTALLGLMFYVRTKAADWPVPFEFGSLLMVLAMAMSAICGSVTMAVGAHSAAKGNADEAVRWIAIAISGWLVFLLLEMVEWVRLVYLVELGPTTPFGATFFLLTGTHWLAVIACVFWFTYTVIDVRRRDIPAAALYSHFLAFWWLVLVATLYLTNANPLEGF